VRVAAADLEVAELWHKEPGLSRSERLSRLARQAMDGLATRAAADGAQLLLLPALAGMLVTPEGARMVRAWADGQPVDLRRSGSEELAEAATTFVSGLARHHGLCVATTGLVDVGARRFHHEGVLFGADGEVLGRQTQTHAGRREALWGLAPTARLAPFDTPLGRVGMVLGADAWHPEVSRILALQGADLLLFPKAVVGPYPLWMQVSGAWEEVQQNQVFGIESGLAGGPFLARAAVFAPCELTPGLTGQLAGIGPAYATIEALRPFAGDSPALREEALVLATLDFAALEEVRRRYPIFGMLNPTAYQRYFPGVYQGATGEVKTP
jgi:predicted amidohydrolase